MELTVKKQLEKQPNMWIHKALTVLFVVLVIVWASKGIAFSGIKGNGIEIAKNVTELFKTIDSLVNNYKFNSNQRERFPIKNT